MKVSSSPSLRRSRKRASITTSRWTAYAGAGAATALAGIHSAEADIHYSGVLNSVFNAPASSTVIRTFALDNNAVIRFVHTRATTSHPSSHGQALFRIQGAALSNMFRGVAVSSYRYPSRLAANVPVSGGAFVAHNGNFFATLAFHAGGSGSQFLSPGTGFIGFRFNNGSGIEYGWARVTMDGAPGNSFTLVDYAWADVGTPIMTGQIAVPEPGSLGLLAVGAAGLVAWRRRRAATAAE